ncbi:MAG TPA: 16S rRNA (adenine(1518)-N(6)/adenine(1519)-N(6))-dimethyltransferase RsmA [Gemmatimonadaceae bacterium]|nr:16S rRNA (adenine(1518)-N(6)/adenine(1519)-N(6))-dimethyltransferase RsmA [Gemmatimonadaceae bacterium]
MHNKRVARGEPDRPRPRKRLGQHFLTDPRILARIANALELAPDEAVVEIGPGRGALTRQLLARAGRVIAVELDRALVRILRDELGDHPKLEIVEGDVLELDLGALAGGPFALAGNVPYYITTPILFQALRRPRPSRAVFLVQREVADRMAAAPGSREYGALSVNLQALADVSVLFQVAAGSFTPPPKVDSAVVRIVPRNEPEIAPELEDLYRTFVVRSFGLRRKQMLRVVRTILELDAHPAEALLRAAAIAPEARPETLAPAQFAALVSRLPVQGGA